MTHRPFNHPFHRRARAFTMLEIMLASVIGAMVIFASIALFNSMDRMDRALAKRADDTNELARLHLVMSRTFSTLVMTDQPAPRNPSAAEAAGVGDTTPRAGASAGVAAAGSTASGSGASGSTSGSSSTRAATTSGASAASGSGGSSSTTTSGASGSTAARTAAGGNGAETTATGTKTPLPRFLIAASATGPATAAAVSPQRLEVVIVKPPLTDPAKAGLPPAMITQSITVDGPPSTAPVATGSGASASGETGSTAVKSATASRSGQSGGSGETSADPSAEQTASERAAASRTVQTTGEAAGVRGFFELVPESSLPDYIPPRTPPATDKQPQALLWRQLPIVSETAVVSTPAVLPEPIVVARGLEAVRWKAFHERERKELFSATWANDLPAYIEMEVRTMSGQYANWMFEVDWSLGPEPGEAPATTARGGGGGAGGRGGPGAGGGGGQGRGPGVGNGQGRQVRVPRGERGREFPIDRPRDGGPPGERTRRDFPLDGGPRDFNPRDFPPPTRDGRPIRGRPAGPRPGGPQ